MLHTKNVKREREKEEENEEFKIHYREALKSNNKSKEMLFFFFLFKNHVVCIYSTELDDGQEI